MSTPQKLIDAVNHHFGQDDPAIKAEILAALDAHFRSPWIFSQDAQPPAGVEVIVLDINEIDGVTDINKAVRAEGSDWTDAEASFWWMHVPPLPKAKASATTKLGGSDYQPDVVANQQYVFNAGPGPAEDGFELAPVTMKKGG